MKKLLFLILTLLFVSCGKTNTNTTNVLAGNSNFGTAEGNFTSVGFSIYKDETEIKSSIKLTAGTKVNFYIFDEVNYEKFKGKPTSTNALHKSALSSLNVSTSFTSGWSKVPIGKYYVVIYNNGLGTARGSYSVTAR